MNRLRLLREFLTLGTLATVASVVGIGTALYGAYETHANSGSHGSANGVPGAMTYVPQWQGGGDQLWQQIMQQWGNTSGQDASTLIPMLQGALAQGQERLPWMTSRMDNMGNTLDALGSRFIGNQETLDAAGGQVFETAMDPRGALHDRTQQQITDASRAGSSARGIGMSPESAGLENQAVSNFNIDWQNQQLQRQLSGLQGLTGAYDAGGRQGQAGAAAYGNAANMWQQASSLPFNLANMFGGAMGSSVYNPWNALQGNLMQYMGLGQSGSQAAFGQGQTNLNNMTSALSSFGNSLSGFQWPSWGGNNGGGSYNPNPSDIGYYGDGSGYGAGAGP